MIDQFNLAQVQNSPCYIIAEIGMNHNGDIELAKQHIKAAAQCGVNAVKFQTFKTEDFLSEAHFDLAERRQYELSKDAHIKLKSYADEHKVDFLSTPFDNHSVDLLNELNVPFYKIASGDLTNHSLISYTASKGKPILLSTGYSEYSEIFKALENIRNENLSKFALMHCVASYPTDLSDVNLINIKTLAESFNCNVGFSDHSEDFTCLPVAAVSFGAKFIEKHFTIDRSLPGYDHHFSLNPNMMTQLVDSVRTIEKAIGHSRRDFGVIDSEQERRNTARRSLFWKQTLPSGTTILPEHLISLRPGTGISASLQSDVIGKMTQNEVKTKTMLKFNDFA